MSLIVSFPCPGQLEMKLLEARGKCGSIPWSESLEESTSEDISADAS
jgi:hypothetical protein